MVPYHWTPRRVTEGDVLSLGRFISQPRTCEGLTNKSGVVAISCSLGENNLIAVIDLETDHPWIADL